MEDFRFKRKISDADIDQFKQSEIKNIVSYTKEKPSYPNRKLKYALSFSLLAILILSIGITILTNKDNNYLNIQQVSATEYIVDASYNGEYNFNLYYTSHIVYENPIEIYDETFGYRQPYSYASQDVQDTFDINFNIFIMNKYTYFLEASVNGENTYMEVDYYPSFGTIKFLDNLEIENFEEEMNAIYNWINAYPPTLTAANDFSGYIYSPNPLTDDLEDSKGKRNYVTYVENYYQNGDDDNRPFSSIGSIMPAFVVNNLVILNTDNTIADNTYSIDLTNTQLANSKKDNYINNQFKFYTLDDELPFGGGATFLGVGSDTGTIILRDGILDNSRYVSAFCYIDSIQVDINDTTYVEISYELHEIYGSVQNNITIDTMTYNDYLIIPPFSVIDETDPRIVSLFNNIKISFYNSDSVLLYELEFTLR
ncbi:MAG: hypothetical protein JEZ05_09930 [Tenericutes bacterium]|nr:hypothetical protein [Mycoplasmatota bacterium]